MIKVKRIEALFMMFLSAFISALATQDLLDDRALNPPSIVMLIAYAGILLMVCLTPGES